MTTKTSNPGNKKKNGGYMLMSMAVGLLVAGLTFSSVIASIASLVRNAAELKQEMMLSLEERNDHALQHQAIFKKE